MRNRRESRTWMTWQHQAYCEAVAWDAQATLRGHVLQVGVLVALVVFFPTVWVVLPAGAYGIWLAVSAVKTSFLLAKARAGRIYPPR
ncbi:hypothetical protein ACWEOE_34085 [Amycolatopsis sp. NPDC004368]